MQIAVEFVTSAAGAGDFPRDRLAEVALVGRSNVGKSSLINALVRRPVARTSAAPGKTRLANIYRVRRGTAPPFYLVDLPGYGYARGAPRRARSGAGRPDEGESALPPFQRLTDAYFARAAPAGRHADWKPDLEAGPTTRPPGVPIGVLLLVDARHPGLAADRDAWAWIRALGCPGAVVGTKVDKLTRAERARHARELETMFELPVPLVSARTGEGLDELWTLIARLPSRTAA